MTVGAQTDPLMKLWHMLLGSFLSASDQSIHTLVIRTCYMLSRNCCLVYFSPQAKKIMFLSHLLLAGHDRSSNFFLDVQLK